MFSTVFYVGDLIVGFGLPVFLYVRHRAGAENRMLLRLFWAGVAVGLVWEVPIFCSAVLGERPVMEFLNRPPLHPFVFLVSHALWDGGIFLSGFLLLRAAFGSRVFQRFRLPEVAAFVLWGQATAMAVEVGSVLSGAWAYVIPYPWNVELFRIGGHPITVLPQLIWLAAPVAYVAVGRFVRRQERA